MCSPKLPAHMVPYRPDTGTETSAPPVLYGQDNRLDLKRRTKLASYRTPPFQPLLLNTTNIQPFIYHPQTESRSPVSPVFFTPGPTPDALILVQKTEDDKIATSEWVLARMNGSPSLFSRAHQSAIIIGNARPATSPRRSWCYPHSNPLGARPKWGTSTLLPRVCTESHRRIK